MGAVGRLGKAPIPACSVRAYLEMGLDHTEGKVGIFMGREQKYLPVGKAFHEGDGAQETRMRLRSF